MKIRDASQEIYLCLKRYHLSKNNTELIRADGTLENDRYVLRVIDIFEGLVIGRDRVCRIHRPHTQYRHF